MPKFRTKLTELLKIQTPVMCAPMAGGSGGLLAAEVTRGGGFGFIHTASYSDPMVITHEINTARSTLGLAMGDRIPIGFGFLGWRLEEGGYESSKNLLIAAVSQGVSAIWFTFGSDLGRWADIVRAYDAEVGGGQKTVIGIQINSVEEAVKICREAKPDILFVQGVEGGGHGSAQALPQISLLPAVLEAVPKDLPVVAVGGLVNGAQLAACLTLGAAGCGMGTRFLCTPESLYTPGQKAALLAAKKTVRSPAFDEVRGTAGWPEGVQTRGLPNRVVTDAQSGMGKMERRWTFEKADADGDANYSVTSAGTSVGLVNELKPAAEVVRDIHEEAIRKIQGAFALVLD